MMNDIELQSGRKWKQESYSSFICRFAKEKKEPISASKKIFLRDARNTLRYQIRVPVRLFIFG